MGTAGILPFQGAVMCYKEATYGTDGSPVGTAPSLGTYHISNKILDARIDSGDVHKPLRGIDSPSVCSFIETGGDNTLHLEYVYQPFFESMTTLCVVRDSDGDLPSMTFIIGTNVDSTVSVVYTLTGCKCKNWEISGSRGEEYVCTADFSVQSVTTASTTTLPFPSAVGYGSGGCNLAGFNQAGSITFTGGYNAYITDSINISVDNNLTDYWNVGSNTKLAAIPGALDVTGSADLSIDEGGGAWWNVVDAFRNITTLVLDTGCPNKNATDDVITLSNGKYDNLSIDLNLDNGVMMSSMPFTFKTIAFT